VAQDFWEYAMQRRRECDELSVPHDELDFVEEDGTNGARGQIHGHVTLAYSPELDTYLDVKEVVVVADGHAHREEYAYYLIVNGKDLWGHERDPGHPDQPIHCHPRDHKTRYPCDPISFKAAVELAWDHVSYIAENGFELDYDPLGETI
jgi:hypothetical protein